MVRAAAKNHANVAVVTSPARYDAVLASVRGGGGLARSPSALAVEASAQRRPMRRGSPELPGRDGCRRPGIALPDEAGLPGSSDPYPPSLTIGLDKVETLRYGENPHQPAARYRRPGQGSDGPFATGGRPLQGKALSYNNVLDASAAAALGLASAGPAS